jgi:hypothetical protein
MNSSWLCGAVCFALIAFVLFVDTVHAQGFDFEDRFPDNDAFESRIRQIDEACLPDPLPLVQHPYGYRLAEGLVNECGNENMTLGQVFKYSALGLGSIFGGPAAPAAAGYAIGELSSDGMKCVLKAFVSASTEMEDADKVSTKSWIELAFTLKDWKEFTENLGTLYAKIPELEKTADLLKLKSAVEAGAAAYERTGEAIDFMFAVADGTAYATVSDAASGAAAGVSGAADEIWAWATTEVSDIAYGAMENRISEAEQAMRDCRYDDAAGLLRAARDEARKECRGYGLEYRIAEVEFRSFIYQNRVSLGQNNALFNQMYERNPQQERYPYLEDRFSYRRKRLADFAKNFDVIEGLQETLWEEQGKFDYARSISKSIFKSARTQIDMGGGEAACRSALDSIRTLDEITAGLTPACRDKLLAETSEDTARFGDIPVQFNNSGRVRSQGWWAELDRIREAFAACDTSAAESRSAALRADIQSNPIYLIENGLCTEIDQAGILAELAGLSSPADCDRDSSTRILPGGLYVSRDRAGEERISKAAPGQEIFIHTSFDVTRLSRSDVTAVNLRAVLPGGLEVPLQSQNVSVRPENEGGYRTTTSLVLPEDAPPGLCRVTGRIRWGGLGADTGDASFTIEEVSTEVGQLVVSPTRGGSPESKYAIGDPVYGSIVVEAGPSDADARVRGSWVLTYPDGHTKDLVPDEAAVSAEEAAGAARTLGVEIGTNARTPLGRYRLSVEATVGDQVITSRTASFEIVPLFEEPKILITDHDEGQENVQSFRPGDEFFAVGDMICNSSNPDRTLHVTVQFTGPDNAIRALDIEGDKGLERGPYRMGARREVPKKIQEGSYTAVLTFDGGHEQVVKLQRSFQIVYPVRFIGIWLRDRQNPPELKNWFETGDGFDWFMQYEFVDVRPGDEFYSAFTSSLNGVEIEELSSFRYGPDLPSPSSKAQTRHGGLIPMWAESGIYNLHGIVWYNDVGYLSPEMLFRIGREMEVTIDSPRPGFQVNDKVLVVSGTCTDRTLERATMITNGEEIPIKLQDGEFSAKTVLRPGRNEIRVVARSSAGTGEAEVWGTANIQAAALKIVLSWEAQGPDIDLWVTDPQRVVTNYHSKKPAEGRNLDVDDTVGPGMETYTVEVPLRGTYFVDVHYYADKGWQGPVPFRLQITTWEATYNERRSTLEGTLYNAAGDREEQGAVVRFRIPLP